MTEFTMKDQSSKPYAWMVEATNPLDVAKSGIKRYVRTYVINTIAAVNITDASDTYVYRVWRKSGEFDEVVEFIHEWIEESIETFIGEIAVPAVYNAGAWYLQEAVYGSRGGVTWRTVRQESATGGLLLGVQFKKGWQYRTVWYSNGWVNSEYFCAGVDD